MSPPSTFLHDAVLTVGSGPSSSKPLPETRFVYFYFSELLTDFVDNGNNVALGFKVLVWQLIILVVPNSFYTLLIVVSLDCGKSLMV